MSQNSVQILFEVQTKCTGSYEIGLLFKQLYRYTLMFFDCFEFTAAAAVVVLFCFLYFLNLLLCTKICIYYAEIYFGMGLYVMMFRINILVQM